MRPRPLLAALALALVLAVPAGAHAATRHIACGSPSATILFWPKGHEAVPGVGFPKISTPHLELYRPGAGYPSSDFLLYADAKGVIDPLRACGRAPAATAGAVAHAKTVRTTKAVTCSAPSALVFVARRSKTGVAVTGRVGTTSYFRVVVRRKGSTFTYDRSACDAAPKPR